MSIYAKVSPSGRISLPSSIRKRLGLSKGGDVVIQETDGAIVIRTKARAIATAQTWARELAGPSGSLSVDDFIAEKRREAADDGG